MSGVGRLERPSLCSSGRPAHRSCATGWRLTSVRLTCARERLDLGREVGEAQSEALKPSETSRAIRRRFITRAQPSGYRVVTARHRRGGSLEGLDQRPRGLRVRGRDQDAVVRERGRRLAVAAFSALIEVSPMSTSGSAPIAPTMSPSPTSCIAWAEPSNPTRCPRAACWPAPSRCWAPIRLSSLIEMITLISGLAWSIVSVASSASAASVGDWEGAAVAGGGGDQAAGALGVGVIDPGRRRSWSEPAASCSRPPADLSPARVRPFRPSAMSVKTRGFEWE